MDNVKLVFQARQKFGYINLISIPSEKKVKIQSKGFNNKTRCSICIVEKQGKIVTYFWKGGKVKDISYKNLYSFLINLINQVEVKNKLHTISRKITIHLQEQVKELFKRDLNNLTNSLFNFEEEVKDLHRMNWDEITQELFKCQTKKGKSLISNISSYNFDTLFNYLRETNLDINYKFQIIEAYNNRDSAYPVMVNAYRLLFDSFNFKVALKLLKEISSSCLNDTVDMVNQLQEFGVEWNFPQKITAKGFVYQHDQLAKAVEQKVSNKPLPIPQKVKSLQNIDFQEFKIIVPDNVSTLVKWGQELNICVGSYGEKIINKKTIVLGLELEGQIKYCIELDPKTLAITQFNGKANKLAPTELIMAFKQILNK